MKRTAYILLVTILLFSCQKADHNGDLGGFWKLLRIEKAEDNSVIDTRDEDRFWSFQLNMTQIGGQKGYFQHVGDSIYIQLKTAQATTDLSEFGIYTPLDERLKVLHLERSKMILRSQKATLTFRKF